MPTKNKTSLSLILKLLAPPPEHKGRFATVVLLTFGMATLEAMGVGSIAPLIALIQSSEQFLNSKTGAFLAALFSANNEEDLLLYLGGGLIVIFVAKMIVTLLHAFYQHSYTQAFYTSLSSKLLNGYTNMPFHYLSHQNSAVMTRNVTTETRLIVDNVVKQGITVASELFVCILLLSVLLYLNPIVALCVSAFSGLLLITMLLATRRIGSRLGTIRDEQQQDMIKTAQSVLMGLKEILLSGRKSFFLDRFESLAHSYAKSVTVVGFIQVIPRMTLEALALLVLISAFLYTKSQGSMESDLPLLVTYIVAGYRLLPSLNRIFVSGLMIYYVVPTLKHTVPLLMTVYEAKEELSHEITSPLNNLTLEDIKFRYDPDAEDIIKNVTLNLNKGEVVGLVGPSGAGKSTLIGILLGLLQPQEGKLLWNKTPLVSQEDIRGLQAKVAYVAQQVFIADDTLLANIALGEAYENIDWDRLEHALRIAQLTDLVNELPQGMKTPIGEKAARLSGGQAQRVGIARALYCNRPILVLDEATSALDLDTEKRLLDALAADKEQRITIVIAHRLTALADCDSIFPLSAGEVGPGLTFKDYMSTISPVTQPPQPAS